MRFEIRLRIVADEGEAISDEEVLTLEKDHERIEAVGLSLGESKTLLGRLQRRIVEAQAAAHVARHRCCAVCGRPLRSKGRYPLTFRTPFGNVPLASPRFHRCFCQPANSRTFSPLNALFTEHTAPELLWLETKWASLMAYGVSVDLLRDVLPLGAKANAETVRRHLHRMALRAEAELGQEQACFVAGCPASWQELPHPEGPIVVGIDGGFVRDCEDRRNHFEVVVGRSMPEDRDSRYFGFVQSHDSRPRRRLFDLLTAQGLQANQELTFLTDGGDSVRGLARLMSPCAEHILDWFHVAMRLTVLSQYAKGLAQHSPKEAGDAEAHLEKTKWQLWHGDVREALLRSRWLVDDLEALESAYPGLKRFARLAGEFHTYIDNNAGTIPNYGERWRYGERISTGFVESTVNLVIGKRFAKKRQMQWSRRGAHLLLQTRTRALDGTLRGLFERWFPGLANDNQPSTECVDAA